MNSLKTAAVLAGALILFGCRSSRVASIETTRSDEFVGTTPSHALARDFLRIPNKAACECIRWQLRLHSSDVAGRGAYTLITTHGISETNGLGFYQGGTRTKTTGEWTTTIGNLGTKVYRLQATAPNRLLSLAKIDENLLQLLAYDGQLMVGNDSWSCTLNRTPNPLDAIVRAAPVRLDTTSNAVPYGPKFLARFVGRSPCYEISNELGASVPDPCIKLKWDVTLFQDAVTGAPTTYRIDATLYRQSPRLGRWKIVIGTENPNAIIYELEAASGHGAIRLLKADDNIMFFVGRKGRLMVGNADFSYTLNRADEKFFHN